MFSVFKKKKPQKTPAARLSQKLSVASLSSQSSSASLDNPFEYSLENLDFREAFTQYLDLTYCTENLVFYAEALAYSQDFEQSKAKAKALHIFETFVKPGSSLEINIDDTTRDEVTLNIKAEKFEATLFEKAAKEVTSLFLTKFFNIAKVMASDVSFVWCLQIYVLMESDSFRKFRRTKEYLALWEKHGSIPSLAPTPSFLSGTK